MELAIAFAAAVAAFGAGVIFGKYVISEAQIIKQHISDAETRIRADVSAAVKSFTARL